MSCILGKKPLYLHINFNQLNDMSVRCISNTPENKKSIKELLEKFPDESEVTIKSLIESWQSNALKEDEDRFPSVEELTAWRDKVRSKTIRSYQGKVTPSPDTIFVFGSNPEGRHGAGAAKVAKNLFGAIYGQGEGLQGNSYALPTKDLRVKENKSLRSISPEQITESIRKLYTTARENPSKKFMIAYTNSPSEYTLNGYNGAEMIGMFKDAGEIPSNIYFSDVWVNSGLFGEDNTRSNKPKSFAEDIAKVSQTFSSIERRNRVNKIARLFSNIISTNLDSMKETLNRQIDSTEDITRQRELIHDLKNLDRFEVIKKLTPEGIFKQVRDVFKDYVEATDEDRVNYELEVINSDPANSRFSDKQREAAARLKATRKLNAYNKVLDNFRALAEEATSLFSFTEGITMDINPDFNFATLDNYIDTLDENGESEETISDNSEGRNKEGWMVNVRQVSSFNTLSNRVRRIINDIARVTRRGTQEKDELGDTVYLSPSYVHAELVQALSGMINSSDLLPMLETLAGKKPWANQVINAVMEDNQVFTSFYRAYRKDSLNYWIQKVKQLPDGSMKTQTISLNKSEGTAHYFDEWRDNYEFGNILDEDSLYNRDGEINTAKAEIGLNIVNELLNKFPREATREEETAISNNPDNIKLLQKALRMLGISINDDILQSSLNYNIDIEAYPVPLRRMLEALRTIYYDIDKGNEKVTNGDTADLINIYGTAFNDIATTVNNVDDDTVESNVRQGDKTWYAHSNPSYLTTLMKKFKREDFLQFLKTEFKDVEWFYDPVTGWNNEWLKELETNPEAREKLNHIVLLQYNNKEYADWAELDTNLALINEYFSSPTQNEEGYAYYAVPVLSDSQSAEFLRGKRYITNYKDIIEDKMVKLVKQEMSRIALVIERFNNGADVIGSYDITKNRDGSINEGGSEFKFFPELNTMRFGERDELSFLDVVKNLKENASTEEVDQFIKETISSIMEDNFNKAWNNWASIGLLDRVSSDSRAKYIHFNKYSENGVRNDLREWYWNSVFAQSQIIQILTTDLAYYGGITDFYKRAKQFHAPAERLNTDAKWDGKFVLERVPLKDAHGNNILDAGGNVIEVARKERTIYLKDFKKPSISLDKIKEIIDAKVAKGELTEYDRAVIISKYSKVDVADAQAYRSLDSFRQTQIMSDMWSEEEETAYQNFKNNTYSAKDFTVMWNTRKPYLFANTVKSNQVNEGLIRVPAQHKNSEMLLLTQAIFGEILGSGKLRAISDFMSKNSIDVVQFESAIKVGKQGVIDLNDISDNDYEGVINTLTTATSNPNYVHEFNYDDYGIQVATPEHGVDAVNLVGVQIRRLVGADANPDTIFEYKGRKWTKQQWFNYFNAINVANIRAAFEELDTKFKDNKEIEKELLREVRSNPRYGSDLVQALSLNEKGEFTIPLDDPSQTLRIQSLLNSILKNRVTKQKIAGGALIQASAYGLSRKPRMVYEGEGDSARLKYAECYIPCPTEELYNLLLDPKTHELDINKRDKDGNLIIPPKYLESIGYRIPTEDKYSMLPLKVIGFLPRQVGSVIILPEEITTISGSDFDVDKMYCMFHELYVRNYDKNAARRDYNKANEGITELVNSLLSLDEEDSDAGFNEWFGQNKEKYKLKTPELDVINYKFDEGSDDNIQAIYENAKKNSKSQRDSLMIDLMWASLTNSDTVGKILNPGGFDTQKKTARIATILNSISLDEFKSRFKNVDSFLKLSLEELDNIANEYSPIFNPLTPDTWVTFQQRNMSGAALIGIAATHNSSHAIMQETSLGINSDYVLTINGNKYSSLHNIKNAEGQFITRNVAGFLAAFVDNAKDPVAGDMNFNTTTANLGFTLVRSGVPVVTTGLILVQPSLKEVVREVNNKGLSMQEAINEVIRKYKGLAGGEVVNLPSQDKINEYNFTNEELVTNILASHNAGIYSSNIEEASYFNNQLKVLYMLSKLNTLSMALNSLTQATRPDSQRAAAGASMADDIIKIEKVENLLESSSEPDFPLTNIDFIKDNQTEDEVINGKLPILQAFYTYGVESSKNLFGRLFPQFNPVYRNVIDVLKKVSKYGNLDVKTRNSIYNDLISYYLTQYSDFGVDDNFTNMKEKRDYYINKFPNEFKKFKEDHPELNKLSFVNRLKVIGSTKYNTSPSIIFTNVGKISDLQKEQYIRDWTTLLYINDETKEMARKLFIYNGFKGFGFSPSGFSHLASTLVKLDNNQYIRTLNEVISNPIDTASFIDQYILNHLDNRKLVPDVTKSNVEITDETDSFIVKLDNNSTYEDRQFAHPYGKGDEIIFQDYVHAFYKGKNLYFTGVSQEDGVAEYKRVKPLGLKNQYVEYEYGVSSEAIESVIPEAKVNNASYSDIYDDYTPTEAPDEYYRPPSISEDELQQVMGMKDLQKEMEETLKAYESLNPNNKDDATGKEFCGTLL